MDLDPRIVALSVFTAFGAVCLSAQPGPEEDSLFPDDFETGDVCLWDDVVGWPADNDNTEATALPLSSASDCDAPPTQRSSILHGKSDVDYMRLFLADGDFCITDPDFTNSSLDGARLCVFVVCDAGSLDLGCALGATSATSPEGRPGCCATSGPVISSFGCDGAGPESTWWLRVDQSPSACASYTVNGHF